MTRATLIIHATDGLDGPIRAEFDVTSLDDNATIELTPTEVHVHTKTEPTVTPYVESEELGDLPFDPRDSDASLAMFEWLRKHGRLIKVGALDGTGYLFVYQEPKGTTKEGYTAGAEMGERIVDKVLETQEGQEPVETSLCSKCLSPVKYRFGEPVVRQEVPEGTDPAVCDDGGPHVPLPL